MTTASDATLTIPAGASGRRILVVDDNPDAAESLAAVLSLTGHEARAVHDGPRAIRMAETFRPDVMLIDIGMPTMSGLEVAQAIRGKPWGATPMLIALTGWSREADQLRSHDAGFDLHLSKPIDPVLLQHELVRKKSPA